MKTVWEYLADMVDSQGLIRANNAVQQLIKLDVYRDVEAARGAVYSVLRRDKNRNHNGKHFVNEGRGFYKWVRIQE